ncbi:interaptin-like isoform X2 [Aphis gossypii]|uniref:interaptin-like isoform X2 n=1 Tax=Aphis gossypii TaxID=80765 RepID=UPI0021599043|nr:interaptin-like isoform X2 [Aphis gossypii]
MSEIEISSGPEDSEPDIFYNMDMFQQMINLCRNNKKFPQKYVEDMNKMYKKCNNKQKNSKNLCDLVLKGIESISPNNEDSFQYAANVYNELLQLTKKDSNRLQTENCVASTSNGNTSTTSELDDGTSNNEISESNKIFKELIEKCYQNKNFPNSNIEIIDKLYNSLPAEFLSSKYFIMLLKEANQIIWPDSSITFYTHMEYIYDQLQQFEASMKVQDSKTSGNNKEINGKKLKQLKKLKTALKVIRKKIKNLDEQEMDINNDDEFNYDSAYILKDKYEKRIVEIYKRMCKLCDEPDFLEEPILRFKGTNDSLVNKTIEKYYNVNKTFPDSFEIYTLLKCLRDKKKLGWTETELRSISKDAFLQLAKQLKLRRINEYLGRLSNVNTLKDPAEENEELRKKLDESNKKFYADLNELEIKFKKKQDYAEETEGSNLNDTECEYSSENESIVNNRKLNKKAKPISIRRKRVSSSESENNKRPKKSQKTIYMESFDLAPSGVTSETENEIDEEKSGITEKVPNQMIVVDNINSMINTNNNIGLLKDVNKQSNTVSKNSNDIMSNGKTSDVNKDTSNKITIINSVENLTNKKNKDYTETLGSNNLVTKKSLADSDTDGILLIDEGIRVEDDTNRTVTKEPLEDKTKEVESEVNAKNHSTTTIDNPIEEIEPKEIKMNDNKDSPKDVIEINELDDSDVEITSCETPIVPVQNKESLESIIKSRKFDEKRTWDNESKNINPSSSRTLHRKPNIMDHNLVNRWIINNKRPSKPNSTNHMPNIRQNNPSIRQPMVCQRTAIQKIQTARQFTQRVLNTVQQQRNVINNQSVLREQVTTMTTTTTVRQIVQKNQVHRPGNSITNNGKKPELIELD